MSDGAATTMHAREGERPASADLRHGSRTGVELHAGPAASSALVRDYLDARPALAAFYAAHPTDADAYRRKAEAVHGRFSAEDRRDLRSVLRPTNDAAGGKLDRIFAGDGVMVTTGQQAGLFGGPMYTVNKILSAIRLAETIEEVLGIPCMAVFWVASDDHDWVEVNHTVILDADHHVHRITLAEAPDAADVPMSERVLGTGIAGALAAFIDALPKSEFAAPIEELLRQSYREGSTMGRAFGDLLYGLFRDHELALIDPASPVFKAAARPILMHELHNAEAHARLLARHSERLVDAGYHAQVVVAEDAANVFYHDALGRERIMREDGGWALRRTKRLIKNDELFAMLDAEPERFSPNVFLRPVVESAVLPTIAYVGGPAEIAYFAQIGCLFHAHDIEPPIVVPRFGVTAVEGKVRKVLDRFDLTITDFRAPFHELVTRVVRDGLPDDVISSLAALRETVHREFARLANRTESIDPTLRGWLTGQRNTLLSQLEGVEKKITSHRRKRSEVEIEQLRKAAANLQPEGTPQERSMNALPLVARYGPGILADMAAAMQYSLSPSAPAGWQGVRCDD